jgi:hypothetical protein
MFTGNGADDSAPLLTVMEACPDWLVNPEMVSEPAEPYVVASAVPFREATELEIKPLPPMVTEKMPRGSCPLLPTEVIAGVGATSVMAALAVPPMPETVTESAPDEGNAAGAV